MTRRDQIIEKIREVPSLPASVVEITRLIRDSDVDFSELAGTIEYDPGLTSNVLKLANSALYGGVHKVNSVKEAVVRLGTNAVYQMVLASAVAPVAHRQVKGYDLSPGALWKHSVAVGTGAEEIAAELKIEAPQYTFTAGLLHNLGKIVMGTFIEIDTEPVMKLAFDEKIPFDKAEMAVLGIDHAEAGSILLDTWGIPDYFVDVAANHHHPEKSNIKSLVLDLVHVADILAMSIGIGVGCDGLNYATSEDTFDRLEMNTEITDIVATRVIDRLGEVLELLPNVNDK